MTGTEDNLPVTLHGDAALKFVRESAERNYDATLHGLWDKTRTAPLSVSDVDDALARVGRISGPRLLRDLLGTGLLSADIAAAHVGPVWSMAEYPNQSLTAVVWRKLFTLAGFTIDGCPAERPSVPVRLYRGSVPKRRADWSWSTSRDVAQRYATDGIYGRPAGVLWTALVPPERLLAENTERDEAEYVVDTDGLDIVRVD